MTCNYHVKTGSGRILLLFVLASFLIQGAFAAEISTNPIPDALHVDINTANGAGYYIKFDGGGLNALHITTSASDPYGQLTTSSQKSGIFYISETGGRGFFNDIILMVAIRKPCDGDDPLPDDLSINIKSSGYTWVPTGVLNQPPAAGDISYVSGAVNQKFTIHSISYGPQKWKPAGNNDPLNYPIYGDQDMSGDDEFYIYFVDLKVGNLGENSGLSGLIDEGAVRVEYTIENMDSGLIAFNAYGWCAENQANQGEGISWTNAVIGDSPSGYVVNIVGAAGGEGGTSSSSSSGKLSYDYDDSDTTGTWKPKTGNLNISSSPVGATIYLDGENTGQVTNGSFTDLPAGKYLVYIELEEYEKTDPRWVVIRNGYVTEEDFILMPGEGSCFVSSVPDGADIYIDGTDTLWHTNSLIQGISSGNHTVTVYSEGYEEQSRNVTIKMDEVSSVSFVFDDFHEYTDINDTGLNELSEDPASEKGLSSHLNSSGEESTIHEDLPGFIISVIFNLLFEPENRDHSPSPLKSDQGEINSEIENTSLFSQVLEYPGNVSLVCEDPTEGAVGRLYVTSYPDDLPITMDGKSTDYNTPKMFYGLKEGFHEVSVKREGTSADTAEMDVWVTSEEDTVIKLKPGVNDDRFQLTVDSKDFRDNCFRVMGVYPEYSFPSEVSLYKSGSFITVFEDYKYYSYYVSSGDENSVLKIERIDDFGIVSVYTKPEGARVFVDGHNTGLITPCSVANVSGGGHVIKVSKDGYCPQENELFLVNTKATIDSELRFVLEEYPYGNLQVDSSPQDAMIYLRGVYTGMKTPYKFCYLPIGTYDVEVVYNRTVYDTGSVTVEPWDKNPLLVYNVTLEV